MVLTRSRRETATDPVGGVVETDIPQRLDRLPWGRFHTLVVAALGITWILDGLEVTVVGAVAGALKESPVLRLTTTEVALASSAYLAGAVLGALFFGWLTDRLGRKKLFFITLSVYLLATAATAFSWSWCRRACAAGPTSSSTAASGWARRWGRPPPSSCSSRRCCPPTWAGAPPSPSARC